MRALLGQLKESAAQGMHDAFTVVYVNVLALTLAYFFLPKTWIESSINHLNAWLMSEKMGFVWLVLLTGSLVIKCTAAILAHDFRKKEHE